MENSLQLAYLARASKIKSALSRWSRLETYCVQRRYRDERLREIASPSHTGDATFVKASAIAGNASQFIGTGRLYVRFEWYRWFVDVMNRVTKPDAAWQTSRGRKWPMTINGTHRDIMQPLIKSPRMDTVSRWSRKTRLENTEILSRRGCSTFPMIRGDPRVTRPWYSNRTNGHSRQHDFRRKVTPAIFRVVRAPRESRKSIFERPMLGL